MPIFEKPPLDSVKTLMGMEGRRVKALYAEKGATYGVSWKGRDYNPENWIEQEKLLYRIPRDIERLLAFEDMKEPGAI